MLILCLLFATSHMQPQQSVSPVQFAEPHLRYQKFSLSDYNSVCINKPFPTNGVTRMLTVPIAAPVNSMNGVYVDWMFSDDLPVTFHPPSDLSTQCNNAAYNAHYRALLYCHVAVFNPKPDHVRSCISIVPYLPRIIPTTFDS